MVNDTEQPPITAKELAKQLTKTVLSSIKPKMGELRQAIDALEQTIDEQGKAIELVKSRVQTLNSILVNRAKHNQ